MKKIILLLSAMICFVIGSIAQDTIYVQKKGLPLIKLPRVSVDSFSIKKPTVSGADTLILYSKLSSPIKIAVAEIDSISFIKPNVSFSLPTTTTISAGSITQHSAQLNGNIGSDGGAFILEKGFVYGTTPNPTVSNLKTINTGISNTLSNTISNLTPNTTYYFRSYAMNSVGVAYGASLSFTTLNSTLATLTTSKPVSLGDRKFTCGGTITSDGGSPITSRGVLFGEYYFSDTNAVSKVLSGSGTGTFTANINDVLSPNTKIYFRAFAKNANGVALGNIDSLVTPIILGTASQFISAEGFNININNSFIAYIDAYAGGMNAPIMGVTHGFCISKSPTPTISNSDTVITYTTYQSLSRETIYINDVLKGNTTYYFRTFISNPAGIAYSSIDSLKTGFVPPSLKVLTQSRVGDTCSVSFSIENDGGLPITSVKYFYGQFLFQQFMTAVDLPLGSSTYSIKQYVPAASNIYFIVAASNSIGEGSKSTFFTGTPVGYATFGNWGNSTGLNEVNVYQTITSDGGSPVTQRGFIYGLDPNPTEQTGIVLSAGTGTGAMTKLIQGLSGGTVYYVKAYAKNGAGTAYSSVYGFTTLPLIVSTGSTSNLTSSSVAITGEVTNDGGKTITESGIVYSTGQNPTVFSSKIISTSQSSFIANLFGLSPGTVYYARAYAKNENGTSYGSQITFTTLPNLASVGITNPATNITKTGASISGNVSNAGGGTITERGFVYSSTTNTPTTSNTKITAGNGIGSFTSTLSGLTAATNYYVRSYAINAAGTSYSGDVILFRTLANLATLGSSTTTNVGSTSVVVFGNVTSDGGDGATEFGFVYSTTVNPTVANSSKVSYTTGLAGPVFSSPITGLAPKTEYFIRAYFTNSAGTAYSPNTIIRTLP